MSIAERNPRPRSPNTPGETDSQSAISRFGVLNLSEVALAGGMEIDADEIKDDDDALTSLQMKEARATCPRCKQGFCTSHGTKLGAYKERAPWAAITQLPDEEEGEEDPQEEELEVGTNPNSRSQGEMLPRICKNEGCGKTFTEEENHSTACHYHRGPISFSQRSTGEHKWICCDVPVSSFEELAAVPPCTRGKHYAPPQRN